MVKNMRYLRASLIVAIFVTGIIFFWSNIATSFEALIGKPSEDIPVLIADHFIPPFQVLKAKDIKIKYFPRDLVPPGRCTRRPNYGKKTAKPFIHPSSESPKVNP